MDFSKNELHLLKYLRFYKLMPIVCMIFGGLGVPYGLYFSFQYAKSHMEKALNNALIGASIAVLGMGYVTYCLVKIVEKFKRSGP